VIEAGFMRFFFVLIVFRLAVTACTVIATVECKSSVEGELESLDG
jgi:hypothetical protein